MKKIGLFLFLSMLMYLHASAQVCSLSGKVTDNITGEAVAGAAISIKDTSIGELTDSTGYFSFCHLDQKEYILSVDYIGYKSDTIHVNLKDGVTNLDVQLMPTDIALKEVIVSTAGVVTEVKVDRNPVDRMDTDFLKTISSFPGVATMNIGAGVSKPVVRGLSSNRVAVINDGILQQNQQWGADHGVTLNQFDVSTATIYKGPYALLFGSSSPAVLDIEPFGMQNLRGKQSLFEGEAILWGASNNGQLGSAFTAKWQNHKWFVRGSYRYMEYNDYRVPASSVNYEGEEILLTDKRVPNTAGKEQDFSGTVGYMFSKGVTTSFTVNNYYQKTGLFELEHDHEDEHGDEEHDHDHDEDIVDTSHSNIGMPYATSNHFTVTNNTEWKTESLRLVASTGYQNNHRREYEHFHEHYEGQPVPTTDDDLAVDFKLQTYTSNIRLNWDENKKWKKAVSANVEFQQNRISGYEYFLPKYNQFSGGLAFISIYEPVKEWKFQGGLRYDLAHTNITGFYDDVLAAYLENQGYEQDIVNQYAQRAYGVKRDLGSFSGGLTAEFRPQVEGYLSLKLNLAKSLRFPSANELASNGVHHAAFRYEIGNPDLNPEHGYTVDFDMNYAPNKNLEIQVNPFFTYYSNFIFLEKVTDSPIDLYDEQPYKYSQAKAIYGGGEYKVLWHPFRKLQLTTAGSLVLNRNIDDDNPLPFTPPFTMTNEIKFLDDTRSRKELSYYQVSLAHRWYADQNRVGVGEEKTKGTNLFDFSAGIVYKLSKKWPVDVNMQVKNIFNTRYLNHMSLYRRINIPEQGRSFQLLVRIPFKS